MATVSIAMGIGLVFAKTMQGNIAGLASDEFADVEKNDDSSETQSVRWVESEGGSA